MVSKRLQPRPFLSSWSYQRIGFGIRHQIKGPLNAMRGHRIASQSDGELSINMLRSVVVSSSPLAIEMARAGRSDVFLCRD